MVAKMISKQKARANSNNSKLKEKRATPASNKPNQRLKQKLWSVSTGVENKPSYNKVFKALKMAVKEGILDLTPDGGYRLIDEKPCSNPGRATQLHKKPKPKRSCPEMLRKRSYSGRRHHSYHHSCRHHRRQRDYSRTNDSTVFTDYTTRSRRGRSSCRGYYYRRDDRSRDMYSDYWLRNSLTFLCLWRTLLLFIYYVFLSFMFIHIYTEHWWFYLYLYWILVLKYKCRYNIITFFEENCVLIYLYIWT